MAGEVQWVSDREVRWQVPFAALDGKKYRVDIYSEGWVWEPVVLKGGANPFYTQEDDDDDVFMPIRTSSGYLTVICENMELIDEILPNDDHDRYVELMDVTDELNEVCVWNGFIAPDQYSGTWDKTPFEFQLPLLSPLAASRGTRFMPLERMMNVYELLTRIFNQYIECHPDYFMFAVLDDGSPDMVPFLSAVLVDSIFMPNKDDDNIPVFGSDPLPPLKSKCQSAVDVLEALCKAFGYVLTETPDTYYFSAPDKTNVYRRVTWENLSQNGYLLATLNNQQFPTIAGSDHIRNLLPGKSLVRVWCEFTDLEELATLDLTKCDVKRPGDYFTDNTDREKEGCVEYLRFSSNYTSWQYVNNPPGGVPLENIINVQWENFRANERVNIGGNWINYGTTASQSVSDFRNYGFPSEEALVVTLAEDDYSGSLFAAEMVSDKKYSAINLQNGLNVNFTAEFSKSFKNYTFDDELDDKYIKIYCVLKWGDYYFQHDVGLRRDDPRQLGPAWNTAFHIFSMGLASLDKKQFNPFHRENSGALFHVPDDMYEELQGNISLMFYTFSETQGVKMFRITNLVISHDERFVRNPVPIAIDYGLTDYRQSLSAFRLSEYSYKQMLTSRCIGWSQSGIEIEEPLTDISYEQLLLSRLAQWYDRTIEQLSVTVENEDIEPGVRIVRGNAKYIVLSRTVDWRNGQRILTLQRMYDEQPQSET